MAIGTHVCELIQLPFDVTRGFALRSEDQAADTAKTAQFEFEGTLLTISGAQPAFIF